MTVDALHHWGILIGFIYVLIEAYVGWKRPLGCGSVPHLLFMVALVGMILVGFTWIRLKERVKNE